MGAARRSPLYGTRACCDLTACRLRLSDELFGREQELAVLADAHASACRGGTEIVLVSGYSGVGKSRLVNELHRPVARSDGWFCPGKFDLYRRDLPYGAFAEVGSALVDQARR